MIQIRTSKKLLEHLKEYEFDGSTVETALFSGGRLQYPGRNDIEQQLGFADPYTLELEARVIEGMHYKAAASVRFLSRLATESIADDNSVDQTLQFIWAAHDSYKWEWHNPSLDRLVAALVYIEMVKDKKQVGFVPSIVSDAAVSLVKYMHSIGLPLTREGLEEIFDGAAPACVGLGFVEI